MEVRKWEENRLSVSSFTNLEIGVTMDVVKPQLKTSHPFSFALARA